MIKAEYIVLILAALASLLIFQIPQSRDYSQIQFEQFKTDFGKTYDTQEEIYRFKVFTENLVRIETHNRDESQTYKMGVTQFSDMTDE